MTTPAARTALVTGGTRGIGLGIARALAAEGWHLALCGVRDADAVAAVLETFEGRAEYVRADVGSTADRTRLAAAIAERYGAVNALVNNAAVSPKTAFKERLGCLNGDLDAWRQVFELNFFAPLALSRGLAAPLARGKGAIVNITSIAGHAIHPFAGSAYSTSKAALSALTREMAVEFAELGVRVNAVAPGEIETAMIGPEYESLIPRIPMHRLGRPEEVAAAVFQLCTEDFGYVTGTEVFVTGGQHLY